MIRELHSVAHFLAGRMMIAEVVAGSVDSLLVSCKLAGLAVSACWVGWLFFFFCCLLFVVCNLLVVVRFFCCLLFVFVVCR